jgi:hypothetical protein
MDECLTLQAPYQVDAPIVGPLKNLQSPSTSLLGIACRSILIAISGATLCEANDVRQMQHSIKPEARKSEVGNTANTSPSIANKVRRNKDD